MNPHRRNYFKAHPLRVSSGETIRLEWASNWPRIRSGWSEQREILLTAADVEALILELNLALSWLDAARHDKADQHAPEEA